MEQIRIIKEMRERDKSTGRTGQYVRPRYMVWENVPGAFSSHKGNDFAAVLEETVHIIEPKAPPIPVPAKGWPTSGCLMGDGWSVAWRVLDAQFWGTSDKPLPQRRRRISLVADFGGRSAPEILFERESVSWNPDESREAKQGTATSSEIGTGKAGSKRGAFCLQGNGIGRAITAGCNGKGWLDGISYTLNTVDRPAVVPYESDCRTTKTVIAFTERGRKDGRNCETMTDTMYALTSPGDGGRTNSRQVCYAGIVRRLTPLECERLQGYPDGWTDIGSWVDSKGKKHSESSDAARYKALGNSIAIPPWKWVLKRLCAIYERDATMASLFDGIGGFPLIWEQLNGKGSCLWASEVEQFPIAVTKIHFPEKESESNG